MTTITAAQCRMARAALQIGVRELAEAAQVSPTTITRLERGEALFARTLEAVRAALEAAGVEFIPENGGGPGVRLRKPGAPAAPDPAALHSVGPEDETRGGHEAAGGPGPTVPGTGKRRGGR